MTAFAALFLPGLAWQYRQFGRLSFARLLGLAGICLYAAALVTYTLLPLPERSLAWCQGNARGINLRPFAFVDDLITNTFDALLGALLWWMPKAHRLREERLVPGR